MGDQESRNVSKDTSGLGNRTLAELITGVSVRPARDFPCPVEEYSYNHIRDHAVEARLTALDPSSHIVTEEDSEVLDHYDGFYRMLKYHDEETIDDDEPLEKELAEE